jgi:DNA-binding MarR family transcriptional regulator
MATTTNQKKSKSAPRKTKILLVIDLLGRREGASLDELSKETGWQNHTVRAALTGLKKKGHRIERVMVLGASRYTITKTPAAGAAQ